LVECCSAFDHFTHQQQDQGHIIFHSPFYSCQSSIRLWWSGWVAVVCGASSGELHWRLAAAHAHVHHTPQAAGVQRRTMAGCCTTLGLHCFQIRMGGELCVVVSHLAVVHMAVPTSCQAMTSGVVGIRCGCCVLSVCICNLRGDVQNVSGTAFQHWCGLGLALHLSIASFLFIGVF
jgi:hypothetical protein